MKLLIDDADSKAELVKDGIITLYAVWEAIEFEIVFNANSTYAIGEMANIKVSMWNGVSQNPYGPEGVTNKGALTAPFIFD